jgi:hypothetical protein
MHLVLLTLLVLGILHPILGLPSSNAALLALQTGTSDPKPDIPNEEEVSLTPTATNPYEHLRDPLEEMFLSMADLKAQPTDDIHWTSVLKQTKGNFSLEVHKKVNAEFCFRVVAELEGSAEETFDLLSDVIGRPKWDDLCEESGILQSFGKGAKVEKLFNIHALPTLI